VGEKKIPLIEIDVQKIVRDVDGQTAKRGNIGGRERRRKLTRVPLTRMVERGRRQCQRKTCGRKKSEKREEETSCLRFSSGRRGKEGAKDLKRRHFSSSGERKE